jgi:O-antigen/teichoic acid export membrane protein
MTSGQTKHNVHYRGRFLRNVGYGLTSNLFSAVVQFFFIAYLFRSLGDKNFGLVALAQGVVASFRFLKLGSGVAIGKRLNAAHIQGDRESMRETFSCACVVSSITVIPLLLVIASILTVFWPLLNVPHEFAFAGRIIFCAIAFNAVLVPLAVPIYGWLHALHRLDIHHKVQMSSLFLRVSGTVLLFELTGASPVTYAFVLAGSAVLALLFKIVWIRRNAPYVSFDAAAVSWKAVRNLLGFSVSAIAYNTSRMLYVQAPMLLVQHFGGLAASALYGVATQVGMQIMGITSNLSTAVTPVAITLHASGKDQGLRTLQRTVIKAYACFAWLIWLGFFFLGDVFLTAWLKKDLPLLAEALPFAFAVIAIAVLRQTSNPFLVALEKLRWPLVAAFLLSIPMFGVMASVCSMFREANVLVVAWGTAAVFFAINFSVGMFVAVHWVGSGIRQTVQSIVLWPMLPASAVAGSLWAYRTFLPLSGWPGVLLGMGIAGVAFVPTTLFGAFRPAERSMILGLLKRRQPKKQET